MAYTTGSATDFTDLLNRLRLWLTGTVGWEQLRWDAPSGTSGAVPVQLFLRGPGAGASRQVYVNIQNYYDVAASHYSWRVRGAIDYDPTVPTWGTQVGETQQDVYFNVWQNQIDYWFYANARRFVVVAKCSAAYISLYAGFFLPWGTPAQYPFPLFIGADFYQPRSYSYSNAARRMFCDPGTDGGLGSACMRDPTGSWRFGYNALQDAGNDFAGRIGKDGARFSVWPWYTGEVTSLTPDITMWGPPGNAARSVSGGLDFVVPTAQGERLLMPAMLYAGDEPSWGVLDGVYAVPGTGLGTEQVITAGERTLRAFQNIQRSSGNDFFAIEEV